MERTLACAIIEEKICYWWMVDGEGSFLKEKKERKGKKKKKKKKKEKGEKRKRKRKEKGNRLSMVNQVSYLVCQRHLHFRRTREASIQLISNPITILIPNPNCIPIPQNKQTKQNKQTSPTQTLPNASSHLPSPPQHPQSTALFFPTPTPAPTPIPIPPPPPAPPKKLSPGNPDLLVPGKLAVRISLSS